MREYYYDGTSSCSDDWVQEIPEYESQSVNRSYIICIGSAHRKDEGKPVCGFSKSYIIPGATTKQAAKAFTTWLKAVVEDIRSKMDEEDLHTETYLREIDAFDPRAKEARKIDKEIEEVQSKIDNDHADGYWYDRLNRLRKQRAEVLTADKEISSRFQLIVNPVLELIDCLEKGWYSIRRLPMDRPIPVSYYDDWRGFTNYQPKDR